MEIYSTGGGEYLATTLNAIAAFFSTNNAQALIGIGLMLGMVILVFQVMFQGDLRRAIQTYVMIAFVGALSIADRTDVIVLDDTRGPLWFRTVDNVPTSVAYIGSATTSVSNALTRQIEALFSPPDNIAYQRHGMLFGATIMTKSARWRAVSSVIHENLTNFMDQCMIDAVELRYIDPDLVTRSGNLTDTITANMPSSLAYYDVTTRSTRLCSEGWPDLSAAMTTEVDTVLAAQAASTFQGPDGATAIADLRNTITDFSTFAGYASASAEAHIRQAMLIAALDDAANRSISATGNAAALEHLQSARAEVQTRSSYEAIGANALSWVPYLKIVFENLYFGAFPIALALMMTPLCLTIIRGYFGGFVWLASWEPLSAILHSLMMNASAERFQTITSASTSGAYTESVMSWANHFGVYSIGQDVSAMAGYLMMSVPFVAAAIFYGANRMVGLATSILAVSQSAAAETGREIATGNLAYNNSTIGNRTLRNISMDNYARNNASYDNVNANRTVTSPYTDVGRSSSFARDGSLITTNRDGTLGIDGASSRVNTATNVALGNSVVGSLRQTSNEMMERGTAARRNYERSHSRVSARTSSFIQSVQAGNAFSSGRGLTASAEERESLSNSVAVLDRFAEQYGVSRQTALEAGVHARAGVEFWNSLSVEGRTSLQRQGVTRESFEAIASATQSSELGNAINELTRASRDYRASETGSLGRTADKGSRDSIDDLVRQARSAETFNRAASSYSEAADRAENRFVDQRVDLSAPFADWMMDRGMSPSQVATVLNGRGDASRSEALRQEFSQQFINDVVAPTIGDSFGNELPSPLDPGRSAAPGQDVYNPMPSVLRDYSRGSLDAQTSILQASGSLPAVGAGGGDVRERADGIQRRNKEAENDSWTQGLHENLGGKFVDRNGHIDWQPTFPNATIDSSGFYRADNIRYELEGKTRSQPPSPGLVDNISRNAARLGDDIGVIITSGGQPSHGPNRTGSHRHDNGKAADFVLTRNGERVTPAQDPKLYAAMIELSARDNPGIGHYSWGLHVGGGTPAFWGPDTTSTTADPAFRSAYDRGRPSQ